MLLRILTTPKFWQLAAIVTLAAIPIIVLTGKQTVQKTYRPDPVDDSDIFDRELTVD